MTDDAAGHGDRAGDGRGGAVPGLLRAPAPRRRRCAPSAFAGGAALPDRRRPRRPRHAPTIVVIAPSNPIVSIGPVRALPGSTSSSPAAVTGSSPCHRSSVEPRSRAPPTACSPSSAMSRRWSASPASTRRSPRRWSSTRSTPAWRRDVEAAGMRAVVTPSVMSTPDDRRRPGPHDADGRAHEPAEVWGDEGSVRSGLRAISSAEIIAEARRPPNGPLQDQRRPRGHAEGSCRRRQRPAWYEIDATTRCRTSTLVEDEAARRRSDVAGDLLDHRDEARRTISAANSGVDLSTSAAVIAGTGSSIDSDRAAASRASTSVRRLGCRSIVSDYDRADRPRSNGPHGRRGRRAGSPVLLLTSAAGGDQDTPAGGGARRDGRPTLGAAVDRAAAGDAGDRAVGRARDADRQRQPRLSIAPTVPSECRRRRRRSRDRRRSDSWFARCVGRPS